MNIAGELEKHAGEELEHALTLAKQIDYLGGMPTVTPKPVKTSDKAEEMLRFDLDNENETIRNYRVRVRQCEALGEYALAEQIRDILVQEQEHQIDLATALGVDVPDVTKPRKGPEPWRTASRPFVRGENGRTPVWRGGLHSPESFPMLNPLKRKWMFQKRL